MDEVTKKRRARSGHRAYATKKLTAVKEMITDRNSEVVVALTQVKMTLNEKIETIKKLDEQILDLLEKQEDIDGEIKTSSEVTDDLYGGIAVIDDAIRRFEADENSAQAEHAASKQETRPGNPRVKLPKLEVRKFNGKISEWTSFWDSFTSAIHSNDSLSNVDKFTYLHGLLDELAKSAIDGFALTSDNYLSTVELLQRRFGNKTVVQRAYINELLNVRPVYSDSDTERLRKLVDFVEMNYRGLVALGIDEKIYSEIVVPSILNKIPEDVRLTITRGKKYLEWSVKDVVEALLAEIELRECHTLTLASPGGKDQQRRHKDYSMASALHTRNDERSCAFCLGSHKHEDCKKVTKRTERLELLRKFNRCFKCVNKGHISRECRARIKCKACGGSHHISICEKKCEPKEEEKREERREEKREEKVGVQQDQFASPSNLHVGSSSRVALQTAQGILKGERERKVRVLFDSGSQNSFVTSRAMNAAKLNVVREKWLGIKTFGGESKEGRLRQVVDF